MTCACRGCGCSQSHRTSFGLEAEKRKGRRCDFVVLPRMRRKWDVPRKEMMSYSTEWSGQDNSVVGARADASEKCDVGKKRERQYCSLVYRPTRSCAVAAVAWRQERSARGRQLLYPCKERACLTDWPTGCHVYMRQSCHRCPHLDV